MRHRARPSQQHVIWVSPLLAALYDMGHLLLPHLWNWGVDNPAVRQFCCLAGAPLWVLCRCSNVVVAVSLQRNHAGCLAYSSLSRSICTVSSREGL